MSEYTSCPWGCSIVGPHSHNTISTMQAFSWESHIQALEHERDEWKAKATELAIARDKEFWKNYADETCRNLTDSNAKLTRAYYEEGQKVQELEARACELQLRLAELSVTYRQGELLSKQHLERANQRQKALEEALRAILYETDLSDLSFATRTKAEKALGDGK